MAIIKLLNTWIYKNVKYNTGDIVKDVPEHVLNDIKNNSKTSVDFEIIKEQDVQEQDVQEQDKEQKDLD